MFSNSPVMNSHDINPIFPISLIKSHVYSYFDSHFPLVNSQFVPEKYHQCCRETHRPPVFSLPDFVECELEGFFPHGYNLSYNNHIITISTLKKSGRVVMWFFSHGELHPPPPSPPSPCRPWNPWDTHLCVPASPATWTNGEMGPFWVRMGLCLLCVYIYICIYIYIWVNYNDLNLGEWNIIILPIYIYIYTQCGAPPVMFVGL